MLHRVNQSLFCCSSSSLNLCVSWFLHSSLILTSFVRIDCDSFALFAWILFLSIPDNVSSDREEEEEKLSSEEEEENDKIELFGLLSFSIPSFSSFCWVWGSSVASLFRSSLTIGVCVDGWVLWGGGWGGGSILFSVTGVGFPFSSVSVCEIFSVI